jgi:hypothetical protein
MLRSARFALLIGLGAAMPVVFALDPPQKQSQNKQETKNEKKAEPAKKDSAAKDGAGEDRLDRRNSRMKERNQEIDGLLNKQKK